MTSILNLSAIALASALALTGLLWIYHLAAPMRLRKLPRLIASGKVDPEDLVPAFAGHFNAPIFVDTEIEALRNGNQIFPRMLEALNQARSEINFLTYVYWKGDIADEFAHALSRAAQRGVEVRVLIDAYGGQKIEKNLVHEMRDAGCRVHFFNPIRWFDLHRSNFRTHRKIVVVDRALGFTGGVGIATEWEGDAEDPDHWRDTHFEIRGPILHGLETAFDENWRLATGEVVLRALPDPASLPSTSRGDPARAALALGRPDLGMSKVALAFWFALLIAQRRIWIQTPYFVPSDALLEVIERAASSGVEVRIMVPGERTDSKMARAAARSFYERLIAAGVELLEYQPTMLHTKIVLVDDTVAVLGSANMDHRSFELNYEVVLAVEDRALVSSLDQDFRDDLSRCKRLTRAEAQMSLTERVFAALVMLFRYQL